MNIFEAKALVDQVVDRNFSIRKADISDLLYGLTVEQQQAMKRLNDSLHSYRNTKRREVLREIQYHYMEYGKVLSRARVKIGAAFTVLGMGVVYITTRHIYASVFAGLATGVLLSSIEKETKIFATVLDGYPKPDYIKGSWYNVQKQKIHALRALLLR